MVRKPCQGSGCLPMRLCNAILEGFTTQLMIDQKLVRGIHVLHCDAESDLVLQDHCKELMNDKATNELNVMQQTERYVDAVTGKPLIPELVRAAKATEIRYFETKGVWHRRPRVEALTKTSKSPRSVKWVDTNKGDDLEPKYRFYVRISIARGNCDGTLTCLESPRPGSKGPSG